MNAAVKERDEAARLMQRLARGHIGRRAVADIRETNAKRREEIQPSLAKVDAAVKLMSAQELLESVTPKHLGELAMLSHPTPTTRRVLQCTLYLLDGARDELLPVNWERCKALIARDDFPQCLAEVTLERLDEMHTRVGTRMLGGGEMVQLAVDSNNTMTVLLARWASAVLLGSTEVVGTAAAGGTAAAADDDDAKAK